MSALLRPREMLADGVQSPGCLGAEPSPTLLASLRGGGSVFSKGTGVVVQSLSSTAVANADWDAGVEDEDALGEQQGGDGSPSQLWAAYAIEGNSVEIGSGGIGSGVG